MQLATARDTRVRNLGENDPIRILHISDLQFGPELPADFNIKSALAAGAIRRHWDGPPTFIAITGDIAERGLPSEYAAAREWLTKLSVELDRDWSDDRFLLIPGNHDLCWPLAWSACIDVRNRVLKAPGDFPELASFIVEPFREFSEQLGGEGSWSGNSQYWTSGRYRRLGIVLFGCNTCEQVDEWGKPKQSLADQTLANLFSAIRLHRKDAQQALTIGLIHHPLNADDPTEMLASRGSFLKGLSDQDGDVLILCGHVHSSEYGLIEIDGIRLLELTASTMTKKEKHRPPDSLRSFGLLTLERKNNRVTGLTVDVCRFERHRLEPSRRLAFKRKANGQFEKQKLVAARR